MEPVTPTLPDDDVAAIDRLGAIYKELSSELSKMIIGQQRVVELLSIALFSRGHALLMGVPGLAKTLLVSSVAKTLDLSFNRIQFTPDLFPRTLPARTSSRMIPPAASASSSSSGGPCSPTSCWRTKSTAPPLKPSPPC